MLPALLALQVLTFLLIAVLLLRRNSAAAAPDGRLEVLLASDLPGHLARSDARSEGLERLVRAEMAQLRQESADAAGRLGQATSKHAESLRGEIFSNLAALSETLRGGLEGARGEHKADADRLRGAVDAQLQALGQRLNAFTSETTRHYADSREALHSKLNDMARSQGEHHEHLRNTVEGRLDKLNEANTAKLEEMRATVDEKLHTTLQTRLTESFGAVTDQLTKVHSGLGEMTKLSAGVDDLSRIFTNVKSRGGFAEVQLGMLLGQMLAPNQFSQNVKVKPNTGEMVEYAVKLPTAHGELLLPDRREVPARGLGAAGDSLRRGHSRPRSPAQARRSRTPSAPRASGSAKSTSPRP